MLTKEYLLQKIGERKAQREVEIGKIPIPAIKKRYETKLESDEKMREVMLEFGDFALKNCNSSLSRHIFQYVYSRRGPLYFQRQFNPQKKPRTFIDSVLDYYMFISSYGAWPLEIAEVTEDRVVVYFDKCTVKCDDNLALCLALTLMEPRLSKMPWFGAKITYTERKPAGYKRCKVVMERKESM